MSCFLNMKSKLSIPKQTKAFLLVLDSCTVCAFYSMYPVCTKCMWCSEKIPYSTVADAAWVKTERNRTKAVTCLQTHNTHRVKISVAARCHKQAAPQTSFLRFDIFKMPLGFRPHSGFGVICWLERMTCLCVCVCVWARVRAYILNVFTKSIHIESEALVIIALGLSSMTL